jgi:two-component system sensor histidine kinase UhpB
MLNVEDLLKETEKLNLNLRKTNLALKRAEERYKRLLGRSSDIIFVHQNGKIVLASKACAALLGAQNPKELIGKDLLNDVVHPDYRKIVKERDIKILKEHKEVGFLEEKIMKLDGEIIDIDVCAVPFTYKGKAAVKVYARDITKQKKVKAESERSYQNLKNFTNYLQKILEEERHKISLEIHDDLGQLLSVLKLDLQNVLSEMPEEPKNIVEKLSMMSNLIDIIMQRLRIISYQLRPPLLDHLGLCAAIIWQINEFEKITNIKCKLKILPKNLELREDISISVFRVLQGALTNILRYSKATKVSIYLNKNENKLMLKISDNGIGITDDKISDPKSLGLLSMKERILNINGTFNIIGKKNIGTTITVNIPLFLKDKKND